MSDSLTAKKIKELLEEKHKNDVFVTECKTGKSMGKNTELGILDGWAMKKSWSNPNIIGYEIKVSRSDFLQDDKWPKYLPYCNRFYFICPYGLIEADELPDNVGLRWVASTGTRIYTKKKAPRREPGIPDSIFRYILMNRVEITGPTMYTRNNRQSKKEFFKQWLEEQKINLAFGHKVGKKIAQRIDEEIIEARRENKSLRVRIETAEEIEELLKDAGLLDDAEQLSRFKTNRIERLIGDTGKDIQMKLETLQRTIKGALQKLDPEEV